MMFCSLIALNEIRLDNTNYLMWYEAAITYREALSLQSCSRHKQLKSYLSLSLRVILWF
jgi:hypothetical protein